MCAIPTQPAPTYTTTSAVLRSGACLPNVRFLCLSLNPFLHLCNAVWEQHKPEMIRKIESHKAERLRRERRELVNNFYKEYKATLKAEKWQHFPPSDILAYEDVFVGFINQDSSDTAIELDKEAATKRLPEIIDDWRLQRQKELYELLPGASLDIESYETPEGEDISDEELERRRAEFRAEQEKKLQQAMNERMALAKTVFTCSSCKNGRHAGKAVIGWEAALTHMCGSFGHYFHSNWEFCSVGYAAAAALARQVGLDSDTATAEEMDKRDARFFCGNCPVRTHNKVQGRKAYTWRECVRLTVLNPLTREADTLIIGHSCCREGGGSYTRDSAVVAPLR